MEEDDEKYTDIWEDEDIVKEMDRRLGDFESGKVKGISWEEIQAKYSNKNK